MHGSFRTCEVEVCAKGAAVYKVSNGKKKSGKKCKKTIQNFIKTS